MRLIDADAIKLPRRFFEEVDNVPLPEPYQEGQAQRDALYPCDPSKNTECRKTGCFKNGGPCNSTRHAEYAVGGGSDDSD